MGRYASQHLAPGMDQGPLPLQLPPTTAAPLLQQGLSGPVAMAPSAPLHQYQQSPPASAAFTGGGTSPNPAWGTPYSLTLWDLCPPCLLPSGSAVSELLSGPSCPVGHFAVSYWYLAPGRSCDTSPPPGAGEKQRLLLGLAPRPQQGRLQCRGSPLPNLPRPCI